MSDDPIQIPNALPEDGDAPISSVMDEVFHGRDILAEHRVDWELGRWASLADIPYESCTTDRNAALLALLAAVANQMQGHAEKARECIRYAQAKGCPKSWVLQILISGAYNQLGRARMAAANETAARRNFDTVAEISAPQGRRSLVSAARRQEQALQLGIEASSESEASELRRAPCAESPSSLGLRSHSRSTAQATYHGIARSAVENDEAPFVLLDSKSIPRSGLHYLKARLEHRFGDSFSFCEWYQEPGCCRQQPCALTGFYVHRRNSALPGVRLIKSHDFSLQDSMIPVEYGLRRVILQRDPLYTLTSWFALDELNRHKDLLKRYGIKLEKVLLKHEKEVVRAAYAALDSDYLPPNPEDVKVWLDAKAKYLSGFARKWIESQREDPDPYVYILDYTEIDSFSESLARELGIADPDAADAVLARNRKGQTAVEFSARQDPFSHESIAITSSLRLYRQEFEATAMYLEATSPSFP